MKSLITFLIGLFFLLFAIQTYQLYQQKDLMESELNKVVEEYASQTLYSEESVRDRVAGIMETYGVNFDKSSFPLKLDEATWKAEFTLDYKKSPNLYFVSIPLSFHMELPTKAVDASAGVVGKVRETLGGASKTQENRLGDVDKVTEPETK